MYLMHQEKEDFSEAIGKSQYWKSGQSSNISIGETTRRRWQEKRKTLRGWVGIRQEKGADALQTFAVQFSGGVS